MYHGMIIFIVNILYIYSRGDMYDTQWAYPRATLVLWSYSGPLLKGGRRECAGALQCYHNSNPKLSTLSSRRWATWRCKPSDKCFSVTFNLAPQASGYWGTYITQVLLHLHSIHSRASTWQHHYHTYYDAHAPSVRSMMNYLNLVTHPSGQTSRLKINSYPTFIRSWYQGRVLRFLSPHCYKLGESQTCSTSR